MKVKELVELLLKQDQDKEAVWVNREGEDETINSLWAPVEEEVVCIG